MGFTKEQLDAVEEQIASLKAESFSVGELSVDQEKTLAALIRMRDVIRAGLNRGGGISFGRSRLTGVDE
ncbi:MAG: hypothetical protein JW885_11485 [Deltaproteobacteria bacterium]|nr:hypothetical protein [Candidatus Zymogenaceae bacterium]